VLGLPNPSAPVCSWGSAASDRSNELVNEPLAQEASGSVKLRAIPIHTVERLKRNTSTLKTHAPPTLAQGVPPVAIICAGLGGFEDEMLSDGWGH